jgi:hypothetical protein
MRTSIGAREETMSTMSSAGWPDRSIAARSAAMFEVTPVEVSLWTTRSARLVALETARDLSGGNARPERDLEAFALGAIRGCDPGKLA